MQLCRQNLAAIRSLGNVDTPGNHQLDLPERVLQFGTGVLLRGLPDFFIEKANRKGEFNGHVVVVKTTASDDKAFNEQDCLYTICTRGLVHGVAEESLYISAAISRVLHASEDWKQVLACAHNPLLSIVISNTTELGIVMSDDRVVDTPPSSFPGKLLAFLYERYKAFQGSAEAGMIIIPTELIDENGQKLEGIVMDLAYRNNLEVEFIEWLEKYNSFCNSLVDRIVPGKPKKEELKLFQEKTGYEDNLFTVCEPYRLWAIEGDEQTKKKIGFAGADAGIIITPDIKKYKELKLRVLNGTHSFVCATAFLSGFNLVREMMNDEMYREFISELVYSEILPSIPFAIDEKLKEDFASQVLGRFANPFLDHALLSISLQYTAKMKMRNLPLIFEYFKKHSYPPRYMCHCLAAYIFFMKPARENDSAFYGQRNETEYQITDGSAGWFAEAWKNYSGAGLVDAVLGNVVFWGTDLRKLNGLAPMVTENLALMIEFGVSVATKKLMSERKVGSK